MVLSWLKESDPSIAFQTMRDIEQTPEKEWKVEQLKISETGWGKQLLELQDKDGIWGGGLYTPKFISTHYTLQLLRRMEMLPNENTNRGCDQLIRMDSVGNPDIKSDRIGTCITGMGLAILAHFRSHKELFDKIVAFLEERQMADGGWNCRHPRVKTTHSSMNTTLSVLEGLNNLRRNFPEYTGKVKQLIKPAHEFLLVHNLYKSHTTGEVIQPAFADIAFPPRWKYNILSALDYFQSIDHPYDNRMEDALILLESYGKNGKWRKGKTMTGKSYFSMNAPRQPSYWNTLRVTRVLMKYRGLKITD